MQVTHAMFAAPKMPNLIASSRLGGLGGLNADMIRPTRAAIWPVYTAISINGSLLELHSPFGVELVVRSGQFKVAGWACLGSVQAGYKLSAGVE